MITLDKLSPTVGAEVVGVDPGQLLHDEALAARTLEALGQHGVLVFRGLHLDDATQVGFSKRLGRVEVFGTGEHPEIFRVTLDPAKNRAASYLRGTFDWHIDGMTEDIPIMASLLAAHDVATVGGETEFASTYAAYDDLTAEEQERFADDPGRALARGDAATGQPEPHARRGGDVAAPAVQGAPPRVDAPLGSSLARPRVHDRGRRRDGRDRGPGLPRRPPRG